MGRPRLSPNATADWASLGRDLITAMDGADNAQRQAIIATAASKRSTTDQHVRRLIHGARFIASVKASDPDLAEALERSSYNVADVISRWHPKDAQRASEAAKAYFRRELTLSDLRMHYEAVMERAPKRRLTPIPGSETYKDAVRARITAIAPWTEDLESEPSPMTPFGPFDLHYAAAGRTTLGVMVLATARSDDEAAFKDRAGAILTGAGIGFDTLVIGPEGPEADRYEAWIQDAKVPRCKVERLTRRIVEVWS